jgi:DNA-binding Xre family transcriptional regulator
MTTTTQISFNNLIAQYPFSLDSIAKSIGITKQFLSVLQKGSAIKRPELMRKHFLRIQIHIRQQAELMEAVKLSPENISIIHSLPFSHSQLSKYCGKPVFFVDRTLQNPSHEDCALLQQKINLIGNELKDITITDYIEHDEIASILLNHKGHQLIML